MSRHVPDWLSFWFTFRQGLEERFGLLDQAAFRLATLPRLLLEEGAASPHFHQAMNVVSDLQRQAESSRRRLTREALLLSHATPAHLFPHELLAALDTPLLAPERGEAIRGLLEFCDTLVTLVLSIPLQWCLENPQWPEGRKTGVLELAALAARSAGHAANYGRAVLAGRDGEEESQALTVLMNEAGELGLRLRKALFSDSRLPLDLKLQLDRLIATLARIPQEANRLGQWLPVCPRWESTALAVSRIVESSPVG